MYTIWESGFYNQAGAPIEHPGSVHPNHNEFSQKFLSLDDIDNILRHPDARGPVASLTLFEEKVHLELLPHVDPDYTTPFSRAYATLDIYFEQDSEKYMHPEITPPSWYIHIDNHLPVFDKFPDWCFSERHLTWPELAEHIQRYQPAQEVYNDDDHEEQEWEEPVSKRGKYVHPGVEFISNPQDIDYN